MSELQIGKKKIGNGYPVYIIAEGCDNHMGDVAVSYTHLTLPTT